MGDQSRPLAGRRYVHLYGAEPAEIVAPPAWPEILAALHREIEHLESHVAAGDTDPYEATYAFLNGSRILRGLDTRDVAISKRAVRHWALEHISLSAGTPPCAPPVVPTTARRRQRTPN